MKNILNNYKITKKIKNIKNFSILEAFKHKFPLNLSMKSTELNEMRNKDLPEKMKQIQNLKKLNINELIGEYNSLGEQPKSTKFLDSNKTEMEEEIDLTSPIMISKKIEKIVNNPHLDFKENQETHYEILMNNSIKKDMTETNFMKQPTSIWKLNKIIILVKYTNILLTNFPNLTQDSKIQELIKNTLTEYKKFISRSNLLKEDIIISINFLYEITKIKDILDSQKDTDKNLPNFINNNIILNEDLIKKTIEIILLQKNNFTRLDYLFKFLFTLAKSKNPQNLINKETKIKLTEYIMTLKTDQEEYFLNDIPKLIIFYTILEKLNLLNREIITNIKYEVFTIEDFHMLYKTLLYKQEFKDEIDSDNLTVQFNRLDIRKQFFDDFSIRKLVLMRETLDWFFRSNLYYVSFINQLGGIQFQIRRFLADIISRILEHVNTITTPEEIVYSSYLMSAYMADPTKFFEVIVDKTFDIEEVNSELLNKFVDSVLFRMKYSVRYDHEIYILNKMKKEFYVPYNSQLDKFIVFITKQFLYKLDSDVQMSPELFLVGLKCLKILFTNDLIDSNYKINESVIQSVKPLVTKCLVRGSKYLKFINTKNIEIIDTLTQILPHVKFYFEKSQTSENKNISEIFDNFLLNLIKQDFIKVEDKLRIVTNISDFMILESMKMNKEIPQIFYEINSYIYKHMENILSTQISQENEVKLNIKKITDSDFFEAKIPTLLINLYNIFSFEKEKYSSIINLISNHIKEKKGLRNLKGYELLKIKKEIMNENSLFQILSNLQTIQFSKNKIKENLITKLLNEEILKKFINDIINTLSSINNINQILSQFNLSSFSYLISNLFEHFSTEEVTKILKILGNKRIENYHPIFIKNLVTRYSDRDLLFSLVKKKEDEFFSLALAWPLFIKNEELVRTILHCHLSKLLQFTRYEIINVLTYNHINHTKLFAFFGTSINKIKNMTLKKKILSDFIHNCTYIGYKMEINLYEEMLKLYNEITQTNSYLNFTLNELNDIIALSVISNILDTSLSKENQKIYYGILAKINREIVNKLVFKIDDTEISYYPSIPSEDRFFQKSLSNVTTTTREAVFDIKEDDEENKPEEDKQSLYMRKSSEGHFAIDMEFENYFTKKRELMYGHQAYLNDNLVIRQIIKKWLIAKVHGMNLEDEYLENQLEQIFSHLKKTIKSSQSYEKFYLKMLSFGFQYNFTIDADYKEPLTKFKIDYLIEFNKRKNFILIVPEEFTSVNIEENKKHPDGVYALFIECIKRLVNINLIPVLESDLSNLSDADYHYYILDKILINK